MAHPHRLAMALARAALIGLACVCAHAASPAPSRGAYLAAAGDCMACHTDRHGGAPFAGGYPINTPFGVIYSTNITPDPDTGIGRYTLAEFEQALRHGRRRDGVRLYPAMPFASFAAMTDADVADLYAFFRHEVSPVRQRPAPTRLIFPFNQRWAMYFWDAAFVRHAPFQPHPDRTPEWNRGAYLTQTLGHCGSCHTPRGWFYQERGYDERSVRFLSGARIDHWHASDLTGNPDAGLGRRSEADLARFLATGHAAGDVAFGSMAEVVGNSTQHLRPDDLAAIAAYLKSLPARGEPGSIRMPPAEWSGTHRVARKESPGAGLYATFCVKCHGAGGSGKPDRFPALAGNPSVLPADPAGLIRLVLEGGRAPATTLGPKPEQMPSFSLVLGDRELAEVLSFIRASWGNAAPPVTAHAVGVLRASLLKERRASAPALPR